LLGDRFQELGNRPWALAWNLPEELRKCPERFRKSPERVWKFPEGFWKHPEAFRNPPERSACPSGILGSSDLDREKIAR
jgi:hypothetical protein